MNDLIIESSKHTPKIHFRVDMNELLIEGRSQPEDVPGFYEPVLNWLTQYLKESNGRVRLIFKLSYFNTASAKIIVDILMTMQGIKSQGRESEVLWYYENYDEDMKEVAEQLSEITGMAITTETI